MQQIPTGKKKSAFFCFSCRERQRRWATDHIQSGGDHVNSPPSWEGDMQSSQSPLCQDQINGNLKVGITALIQNAVQGRGQDTIPVGNLSGSKPIPLVKELAKIHAPRWRIISFDLLQCITVCSVVCTLHCPTGMCWMCMHVCNMDSHTNSCT